MIGSFLKRLFGSGAGSGAPETAAREDYRGFELLAIPRKDAGGWRVAGSVVAHRDGEERRHDFVRADVYPGRETAAEVSLRKARQIVDEQGDGLFGA
jgi:hypothetical protein